jgi:uncharacterized protein (TIGR02594 family)
MPINYDLLNSISPGKVLANLPTSPQQDDGMGGFLEGLGGLIGTTKSSQKQPIGSVNPASVETAITNPGALDSRPRMEQIVSNNPIFNNAQANVGLKEGSPVLAQYLSKANPNLDPSVTPWCAGFVGSVLNASGLKGTGSLAARSYLNFGSPVDKPSVGDVVVLSRGSDPSKGHVGFYAGQDRAGNPLVLGGNQDNSVSIKAFPSNRILGFRRPPSGQEVQQFAQQNNIKGPGQLANLTNPKTQSHPMLQQTMKGIANVESSGSKNPYSLISKPSRNGDRAYGKYQIMGKNIGPWSKAALGRQVSRDEFLSNPELQEQIASHHINNNLNKYNDPEEAASVWFSGRPKAKAGNSRDVYGTTVPDYIKKFNEGFNTTLNNDQPLLPSEPVKKPGDSYAPNPLKPESGVNWGLLQSLINNKNNMVM